MSARLGSSGISGGESVPCSFPPSGIWPAILDIPWLVEAFFESASVNTQRSSLCVSVISILSSYGHGHWVRPIPIGMTSSELDYICKLLFPNEVTFTGSRWIAEFRKEMLFILGHVLLWLISQYAENSPGHLRRSCSTVAFIYRHWYTKNINPTLLKWLLGRSS